MNAQNKPPPMKTKLKNKFVFWANKRFNYSRLSPMQKKAFNICEKVIADQWGITPYVCSVNEVSIFAQNGKDLKQQVQKALRKKI